MVDDDVLCDLTCCHAMDRRHLIHDVAHDPLDDGTQTTRARLMRQRFLRDQVQCILLKCQTHTVQFEQLLELLDKSVLRLCQNANERFLIEGVQRDYDRQTPNELGNQPILHQILGDDLAERSPHRNAALRAHLGTKAHLLLSKTRLDDLLKAIKRTAADKEDVRRIDLQEFLLRMLASALRRHGCRCPLKNLEKPLLNALPRDISCDGGVLRFTRNLIDLVDVDDAALCLLDVVIRRLNQLQQDVLDILADIACLRERGRISDGKRHIQDACQRLRQQRLAAARGADHEDVRLAQLHIPAFSLTGMNTLVVIVDRHGK